MYQMAGLGKALPARKGGKGAGKKPPRDEDDEEEDDDPDFEVTETNVPGLSKQQLLAMMAGAQGGELAGALQAKLDSMVGRSSGYLELLPGKARFCCGVDGRKLPFIWLVLRRTELRRGTSAALRGTFVSCW